MTDPLSVIPGHVRDTARAALESVLVGRPLHEVTTVSGGATGASIFRFVSGADAYLLRVEGPASSGLPRNPHRFECLRRAADAGVAPAVRYVDEGAGSTVTDFLVHRSILDFPGGDRALAEALGRQLRRLQTAATFPALVSYPDLVAGMLERVDGSGLFAEGVLAPCFIRLVHVRAACAWNTASHVASHNDPNPGNILFDGDRLWLIDWETAYRNDPLVDVSIVIDNLARSPEFEGALLAAWLGRPANGAERRRLSLIRALTRLYYAGFLLNAAAQAPPDPAPLQAITPPSASELQDAVRRLGRRPDPYALLVLGRTFLLGFLNDGPMFHLAEAVAGLGG